MTAVTRHVSGVDQVHYSLTGEGSPQEPRPVSLLGLDSGIYFRRVVGQDMGLLRQRALCQLWL